MDCGDKKNEICEIMNDPKCISLVSINGDLECGLVMTLSVMLGEMTLKLVLSVATWTVMLSVMTLMGMFVE